MKSEQLWRLQLKEGAMCVVHYPSADSSPVLQALNIAESMPFSPC